MICFNSMSRILAVGLHAPTAEVSLHAPTAEVSLHVPTAEVSLHAPTAEVRPTPHVSPFISTFRPRPSSV